MFCPAELWISALPLADACSVTFFDEMVCKPADCKVAAPVVDVTSRVFVTGVVIFMAPDVEVKTVLTERLPAVSLKVSAPAVIGLLSVRLPVVSVMLTLPVVLKVPPVWLKLLLTVTLLPPPSVPPVIERFAGVSEPEPLTVAPETDSVPEPDQVVPVTVRVPPFRSSVAPAAML